jgi:hypothetical protein
MILKVHLISEPLKITSCTWRLHCFDSTISVVVSRGRLHSYLWLHLKLTQRELSRKEIFLDKALAVVLD